MKFQRIYSLPRLKIIGLALACLLTGWLLGSSQVIPSPVSPGDGRWVMTGPQNVLLLDTRTGHTWRLNISSSGMGFSYMPKPTPRQFPISTRRD